MTRIWFPLSLVAILIAGFLLFLLPSSSVEDARNEVVDSPTQQDLSAPAAAVESAPTVESLEKSALVVPSRVTLAMPASVRETEYATPSKEGLLVTVLDGTTQEPLPRAEIMVIDTGIADMRLLESEMSINVDFEKVFENLGVLYRTDHNAQVRIPFALKEHIIAGRTPTHFNFSFDIDHNADGLTLYLNPIQILRVKVVDTKGNPVKGAPISLRVRKENSVQDFTTAYSNAEGFAELKLFQLLQLELADDETYAALLVLRHQPVEARIHLNKLPEEPPTLVLPEAGQVEVHVIDHQGETPKETFLVNIDLLIPEDTYDDPSEFASWNNPREHLTGRTKNGVAHFPLVELDQRLKVTVVSQDGERRAKVFGGGPVRNGEPTIFTLIPEAEDPVVVARILNTEGVIGANLLLNYQIETTSEGGGGFSRTGIIRTDENGRFRYLIENLLEEGGERLLTVTMRATKEKPERTTVVDLSYSLAPGENDLGDLIVTVPPLVASGIVVDTSGAPIRGAQILLERKSIHGARPNDYRWNGIWEHRAETNRDGYFSIRGTLPPEEYRVSADHDRYSQTSLRITQGQEGLRFVLNKSVKLKGRFLLDDDIDPSKLKVILQIQDPNRAGKQLSFEHKLKAKAGFTFKDLPPGPATLILRSAVFGEELFLQKDLILTNQDDPQTLNDIDLQGALGTIRIWVRNRQGALIPKIHIWPSDTGGRHTSEGNPFVAITRETGLDFQIAAPGYRKENLVHVLGDQELILQSGYPVQARITNLHILPDGWKVILHFQALTGPGGEKADPRLNHRIESFGPNAELSLFMDSGTYSVRFLVASNGTAGNRRQLWLKNDNTTIAVADLALPQSYTFTINETALAETLAKE